MEIASAKAWRREVQAAGEESPSGEVVSGPGRSQAGARPERYTP